MDYFCNPMNIEYKYQFIRLFGKRSVTRETADPSVVLFKGEYYLFSSMLGGFHVSRDLVHWDYYPYQNLPAHDYAPDVEVVGDYIYFCASNRDYDGIIYRCKDPKNEPFEEISASFRFFDPKLFSDGDKVYFYWGCSDKTPIMGVELDPENMTPKGEPVPLIRANGPVCGYERMGEDHRNPQKRNPYIEGAWMTKHNGKYYLQYACNGTEYMVYADGVYQSDHPLGPFTLAKNNPYSYKPGGFANGAGHGSTFWDVYGNVWHIATMTISKGFMFERRLGLWPAGFDEDGELFCNQRYGDWVHSAPEAKVNPWANPEWMLLSYKKRMRASSFCKGNEPEKAADENIRTWWRAASNQPGQWLELDLGKEMDVRAIQINFADHKLNMKKPKDAPLGGGEKHFGMVLLKRYIDLRKHVTQWKLEGSCDGKTYFAIEDKSNAKTDLSHDLVIRENGIRAQYIRLTVQALPFDQPAAVSGLRVFGKGGTCLPTQAKRVRAIRLNDWDMEVSFAAENVVGYNILWGYEKDKLYHSYMAFDAGAKVIGALVKEHDYYVRVDTFNECGITKGEVIKLQQEERHE